MFKKLDGVPGIQTVTNRGIVNATALRLLNHNKPELRNFWLGTQRAVQNLITFPEEAVGVGAKWEVIQDINLTTSTRQTVKYELVAVNRRGGTVQTEIIQEGRPSFVPGMSNNRVETYLDSLKAKGGARLDFEFDQGISFGRSTMTTVVMYTAESDTEDNITEYRTVQKVTTTQLIKGKPRVTPKKRK